MSSSLIVSSKSTDIFFRIVIFALSRSVLLFSYFQIYREDEFECSDVCECEIGEKLSCKTLCIDRMPCKTEFAFYNHAAPAYQAYRGRCLCYSGRFICMKPAPTDYSLPQGVYLFLGYSEVDERELNKNHTRISLTDVVRVLQKFVNEISVNGVSCSKHFFTHLEYKNLCVLLHLYLFTYTT